MSISAIKATTFVRILCLYYTTLRWCDLQETLATELRRAEFYGVMGLIYCHGLSTVRDYIYFRVIYSKEE